VGADQDSPSAYARSKALGEAAVLAQPEAIVFRPSLLFGPGDSFFNRFAALARLLPVLPIAGAQTRFQPVAASDVAEAIARAVDGRRRGRADLRMRRAGDPDLARARGLRGAHDRAAASDHRPAAAVRARAGGRDGGARLPHLGLLPNEFKLTRDQVALLQHDNLVSREAIAEGRTLEGIGITPTAFEGVVPAYLTRFRPKGQFDVGREAEGVSETPDTLAPESARSRLEPRPGGAPVGQKAPG
jgi:NADH dehydrogenase